LREKGGVRAVVKAPGWRLFKRRKSPSVIIRKWGIGEQQLQHSLDLEDWEFAGDEEEEETEQTESEEGSGTNDEAMFFSVKMKTMNIITRDPMKMMSRDPELNL
jgi:hypothetical protein